MADMTTDATIERSHATTKAPSLTDHRTTVLLIDDQPIVGEMVRRMLADETDIAFHYCKDPAKAIETAESLAPTVILQDLVMPDIDGLELVAMFRRTEKTSEIPLIVLSTKEEPKIKAEAFGLGANDYLVKLPDKLELLARIRYHSKGYVHRLQRDEAYRALVESQRILAGDMAQASRYVQSILPAPIVDARIATDWRFIPSTQLGGDAFSYHWIDKDRFAFYLLDVCGHGVGAALLSVSVLNALRSQSLPNVDFDDPASVLAALNRAFPMEQHNDMYFTMWYGIYNQSSASIRFAGGGHPPALLLTGESASDSRLCVLDSKGPMVGALPDIEFASFEQPVDRFSKLFLFSDGVYEIERSDGSMWPFRDFVEFMSGLRDEGNGDIDVLIDHARSLSGKNEFKDDFSMVEFRFLRP